MGQPVATDRLPRLIEAVCARQVDAVTFTSAPGAEATLAAAADLGRLADLLAALQSDVLAAAVGPITAAPLIEAGVIPRTPDRYRLGALVRLVCDTLITERVRASLRAGGDRGAWPGRPVDGRQIVLSPNAVALFSMLAAADGGLASELLRCLPAVRGPRPRGRHESAAEGAGRTRAHLDRRQAWVSPERDRLHG